VTTQNSAAEFSLFSDGGSSTGKGAAGAAVVENHKTKSRTCYAAYLGQATNNEAEIVAALLGFSAIHFLRGSASTKPVVHWVSDSEYLLKSATGYIHNWQRNGWKTADKKPVKNQGLWRMYLSLTSGMSIVEEHVRGHTGHPENEACDTASQWLKSHGEDLFTSSPVHIEEIDTHIGCDSWLCVDAREALESLRQDSSGEEFHFSLLALLRGAENAPRGEKVAGRFEQVSGVLKKLEEALQTARDEGCPKAAAAISKLIRSIE